MRFTQFFTATILNWIPLLENDAIKDIIVAALSHRVRLKQVRVNGFVIMPNHMHLIWYINPKIERADFQRDFLKYISKQIILYLNEHGLKDYLFPHIVNAPDRVLQIWERNALSVDIYSSDVFRQKLNYIHNNPLQEKWQLSALPEAYRYSSAGFYLDGVDEFGIMSSFVQHY